MKFYRFTHPEYATDQKQSSENPIRMSVEFYVPGIICPSCAEVTGGGWASSDRVRVAVALMQASGIPLPATNTDWIGTEEYNQALSERRAAAVKAYLVSKGIDANRIYTEGKGELQPIADNRTREGRAKNRRVEVEVVGTRPRR